MSAFVMNGIKWQVKYVHPYSTYLYDRTGVRTVATTDPSTKCIYISTDVRGDFLVRVVLHELGHVCMISFNLTDDIYRMVKPEYWIEAEEWMCNFIADYGMMIFKAAYSILGYDALSIVPYELERWIA